ncbi:GNAT family N-acetyltransferase [Alkalicaulis satelles]|uniref:GNAT family N-acetyltransferase n=1 Tax=Alkalicaulis satelles TaxID=2609175 RepID=UPI0018EA4059|nr:GNAT family N-acetyltransferase [Alkalicaulis satelles]
MSGPEPIRFRKVLDRSAVSPPVLPDGVRCEDFTPARHAFKARRLLNDAYRNGGGAVRSYEEWWPELHDDSEYDPALCFVVMDASDGEIAGFAQCWTSAFVKDIAVAHRWRRKGLGAALMQMAFNAFAERKAPFVDLKVESTNPHGALHLYRSIGMNRVAG